MYGLYSMKYVVVAAATLVFVSACTPAPDSANMHWSLPEAKKENKVDWVELQHEVLFEPGSRNLTTAEKKRLRDFLARTQYGYGDRLFVSAGEFSYAESRRKAVNEALSGMGFREVSQLKDNGKSSAVTVIVGRYVVTGPNCPDWRKPSDADRGNTPLSNHGCATVSNLGAMVANPEDLVRGRAMGPADGDTSAMAIERYKTDKIKPLEIENTSGKEDK